MSTRRSPLLAISACALACACVSVLPPLPQRTAAAPPRAAVAPSRTPATQPRVDPEPVNDFEPTLRALGPKFTALVAAAEALRLQILFGEIVDDPSAPANGTAHKVLRRHAFRLDAEYFYPASAIKLCAAIAALEKVSALRKSSGIAEVGPTTTARFFPMQDEGAPASSVYASSIGQEVRAALVISENDSYNRLFAFVGHKELNERMWSLGAKSVRANHRVGTISTTDDAHVTPRVDLVPPGGKVITTPKRTSKLVLDRADVPGLDVGSARVEGGRVVSGPMSFAARNRVSLRDLQDLLIKVVRPDLLPGTPLPELDEPERAVLLDVLRTVPSESKTPFYTPGDFPDAVHKPFLPGILRVVPRDKFALYSKGGRAYGFRVENAYVEGAGNLGSFFLSVAMWADADGTVNDDTYDYDAISDPFLTDIAEALARSIFKPASGK